MLADQCLLSNSFDGVVQLTITPQALSRVLEGAGGGGLSPDEAEADLTAAVAAVYTSKVLASPRKLRSLKSSDPKEVPYATSFLALSVLAAFHMRTDDEHSGRAFYPRLASMLGCELTGSSHPVGFEGGVFLELWEELDLWLTQHHGRRLAIPDSTSLRRYIALPFAHVPLRQVDLERLPQFFETHGFEPGERPPIDRLAYDLYDGSGAWRSFTESGQSALQDPHRRPFVVRQVAHELERWDGSRTDSTGARVASIELGIDIRQRRAQLHLLARRPAGFPDLIEDSELVFEAGQEGWYAPIPLSAEDGPLLSGLKVRGALGNERFLLQLRSSDAVPLTPGEEYTGFVSDRVLRSGARCAVLCRESIVDEVARFLEIVGCEQVRPRYDETIPAGWCLFMGIRPTNSCPPPPGLERLSLESSVTLVPTGGLRLGRRWTWLAGALARVTVVGSHRGLIAKIDGQEAELDENGCLSVVALQEPGQHFIEIGNRIRQRVIIQQGTVHPGCEPWPEAGTTRIPVAIPAGHWFVIGASPGQCRTLWAPPGGALVRPDFRTQWAVQVGPEPGAIALHLHDEHDPDLSGDPTSEIAGLPRASSAAEHPTCRWEETIYQAGIRRPRLLCYLGCPSAQLSASWRHLLDLARARKREIRRRCG